LSRPSCIATGYINLFEIIEEPDYLLPSETDAAVGVPQSKEKANWVFSLALLIFRIQYQMSIKD